jgi:hypothetical protein
MYQRNLYIVCELVKLSFDPLTMFTTTHHYNIALILWTETECDKDIIGLSCLFHL